MPVRWQVYTSSRQKILLQEFLQWPQNSFSLTFPHCLPDKLKQEKIKYVVSLSCKTSSFTAQPREDDLETAGVEWGDVFTSCAEEIKICLIVSKILFTICARDSFILGQQMAFLEM